MNVALRKMCLLSLMSAACGLQASGSRAESIAIIPKPMTVQENAGTFQLPSTPTVAGSGPAAMWLMSQIGGGLSQAPPVTKEAGAIRFVIADTDNTLGEEGYTLDINGDGIVIRAKADTGLFYGAVSLMQMLPPAVLASHSIDKAGVSLPYVHIVDKPRFQWRGLMLDCARHFTTKDNVEHLLDQMAMHKLNVFHWHLTDDQGWRIEIKQYPKLTSIGAWRDKAGFGMDPKLSTTYGPDGKYGGFYTQDDIKEVVAYAAKLHILIVPEIEMPGHASAALRAYPEYFVPAPPPEPGQVLGDAGIFNGIYEPANDQTFVFLQNVLTEVMALFPSPYIHVGGDEVPKGPWEHNPVDIAFMKAHHMAGGEQLQSYFVTRIGKFITSQGRRMIGWDEILEGGLAPDAVVMSWRGTKGGLAASKADHDVVMTPSPYVYLDYEQGRGTEPREVGGFLPIRKTYGYEPVPEGLTAAQAHHVLGIQGNLWTEYVPNFQRAEYMFWPRAAAVAETGWTAAKDKNWDDFARRLKVDEQRDNAMGIDYRPLQDDDLKSAVHLVDGKIVIDPLPGTTVHYTIDGTFPTIDSPTYTGPIDLPGGFVQAAARYFTPGIQATPAAAADFLDGHAVHIDSTMSRNYDTRQKSFFTPRWGGGEDDMLTVTFDGGPVPLHSIEVMTGNETSPGTKLKSAELETSVDGKTFTSAAPFTMGDAHAEVFGKPIAAFRVHILAMQMPHPDIRSVVLK